MKAVVFRAVHDMRIEELPDLVPAPDEMLIRIKAAGICGTDTHMLAGTNDEGTFPFVPGHEWSGEVVEIGPRIKHFQVGDHVVGEPFTACGVCPDCRDGINAACCVDHEYYGFNWERPGGFAEYTVARENRTHKVPDGITFEESALIEPLSVPYHGIWGVGGGVAAHDRALIFGAGPIGLLALAICKVAGAMTMVVEPGMYRAKLAMQMGADEVINPRHEDVVTRVRQLTRGRGASLVVECSGADAALKAMIDAVQNHARIVLIGHSIGRLVPVEIGKTIWKETTIVGGCDSPHFFPKALEFMSRQLIDITPVISHRFGLDEATEGFTIAHNTEESAKVLVLP